MQISSKLLASTFMLSMALSGCGTAEEDISKDLKSTTTSIKGKIEELPKFSPYMPTDYSVAQMDDPFGPAKAQLAGKNERILQSQPDMTRVKQPLEAFPLETLEFNGTIIKNGVVNALIANQDGLYTVNIGNFIGQNHGRVIKISENEVVLMEEIQENNSEWIKRENRLALPTQ